MCCGELGDIFGVSEVGGGEEGGSRGGRGGGGAVQEACV